MYPLQIRLFFKKNHGLKDPEPQHAPYKEKRSRMLEPMAENIMKFRKAGTGELEAIERKISLRVAYSIAASEVAATFIGAPIIGMVSQYASGNAYIGVAGTVVGHYLVSLVALGLSWFSLNSDICRQSFSKAREFAKDSMHFFAADLIAALPSYAASAALSSAYVRVAETFSEKFAHGFPVAVIAETANYMFSLGIYLAVVFKLLEKPIQRLAEKHEGILGSRSNSPDL